MEMCYNGALIMPVNYAVLNEEEMIYTDGGLSVSKKWYGWQIVLSARECGDLAAVAAMGTAAVAAVAGVLGLTGIVPAAIVSTVVAGVIGVCSGYMWLCSNHRGATITATYIGMSCPVIRW